MKSMLVAFVVTGVIAVGADIVLDGMGYSAEERMTSDAVRLDSSNE